MKKSISIIMLFVMLIFGSYSCGFKAYAAGIPEITAAVTEDTKFGSATVELSQEAFESAGFVLGDSCDIEFENGKTLENVPYYNGYYVKNGMPVVVAYPGSETIVITYNNVGIWEIEGLKNGDLVTIRLNQAQKYSSVQSGLSQVYSFERNDYSSDEEFCNFRALSGGKLKDDMLYRGASPVDNSRNRASYTDALLEQHGIRLVLDLADSQEDIEGYLSADDFQSPYSRELYESGNVILLNMGSAYGSEVYRQKVASGMQEVLKSEGPIFIHCKEGKDRTGFVCTLLEALAGASYEEMRADYMKTYQNYYGISKDETPDKYEAIADLYFDAYLSFLHGTEDTEILKKAEYTEDAKAYLINGGMTEDEVTQLLALICV